MPAPEPAPLPEAKPTPDPEITNETDPDSNPDNDPHLHPDQPQPPPLTDGEDVNPEPPTAPDQPPSPTTPTTPGAPPSETPDGPSGDPERPRDAAPPPSTTGGPSLPPTRTRGRRRTARSHTDWLSWWKTNRWAYLPDRLAIARRRAQLVTPNDPALTDASKRMVVAKRIVIPYLLAQLDPKAKVANEVRVASLEGLAKLANTQAEIDLIARYMLDKDAHFTVRESAALALGLLRRTDPALQASGATLDGVRAKLLQAFDDDKAPWRARAYAALSVGLLGDQPFGDGVNRDGLMASRGLWMRLGWERAQRELTVALITALGMQPRAGVPETVDSQLRKLALGRRVHSRSWSDLERSHALTAVARLQRPGWAMWLGRTLSSRRAPEQVLQAAWIALGANAADLTPDERMAFAKSWKRNAKRAKQPLTNGLMRVAQGRLLAADFADGRTDLLTMPDLGRQLLDAASRDPAAKRGFSTLALALAVREAKADDELEAFADEARSVLTRRFLRARGGPLERAADAAALGLVQPGRLAREGMCACLEDKNAAAPLRAQCAVSLGQCGTPDSHVRLAMIRALWDRRDPSLPPEAALGLSFLPRESSTLVRELSQHQRTQWGRELVSAAMGRLADMRVVPDVLSIANAPRANRFARAAAISAMSAIADPEPQPSLLVLALDGNHATETQSLRSVLEHL